MFVDGIIQIDEDFYICRPLGLEIVNEFVSLKAPESSSGRLYDFDEYDSMKIM